MEHEGVIKYQLDFQHRKLADDFVLPEHFNNYRAQLKQAGLLGQNPQRYDGLGFGNISFRSPEQPDHFVISGTQTGEAETLSMSQLACITDFNIHQNALSAYGETPPSSEAMTHGVIYRSNPAVNAVIHVHSPDIWNYSDVLKLSDTSALVPYGAPEMANAVEGLVLRLDASVLPFLFVMKGHEDGIVAAGVTLESCTDVLLDTLSRSHA